MHRILIGAIIYFGGAALTAGLMIVGSRRSGERPGGFYDRAFLGLWIALWPIGLPVVLSVMADLWGPREDGEGEGDRWRDIGRRSGPSG